MSIGKENWIFTVYFCYFKFKFFYLLTSRRGRLDFCNLILNILLKACPQVNQSWEMVPGKLDQFVWWLSVMKTKADHSFGSWHANHRDVSLNVSTFKWYSLIVDVNKTIDGLVASSIAGSNSSLEICQSVLSKAGKNWCRIETELVLLPSVILSREVLWKMTSSGIWDTGKMEHKASIFDSKLTPFVCVIFDR